jgi:hypothetical protein
VDARRVAARLRDVARKKTSYRELARVLKASTGDRRWSHVKLRRFEQDPEQLSAAELVQLSRVLAAPPAGRKRDRRLEKGLDDAREIVNACDPWVNYHREAARYVETRDRMTPAECKRAWRAVDLRYQECGHRDADGRPRDPDYQLTLDQAVYRLIAPCDANEVTPLTRFVQRRLKARQLDDEAQPPNPRARLVLEQLRALPAAPSAVVEQPFLEFARAARWAQTVAHQRQDATAQEERRRRAAERDGPAQLVMGTPPSTDPAECGAVHAHRQVFWTGGPFASRPFMVDCPRCGTTLFGATEWLVCPCCRPRRGVAPRSIIAVTSPEA